MLMRESAYRGLFLIVLSITVVACGSQTSTPTSAIPAKIATVELDGAEQSITPALTEPTKELPAPATLQSQGEVSPVGPWLVFATDNAIWVANADGSGASQLASGYARITAPVVAVSGGHAAYITADQANYSGLELHLLDLPSRQIKTITPLTSATTAVDPDTEEFPGSPNLEIARAILDVPSLAWSPDGTKLAFIGAIDGPSADLYVYALSDGSITRLTDGPSQGYQPIWSPDGQIVIHAGADSFGTGAGYAIAGVWAARADASEVKTLYEPDSSDEIFVGWVSNRALLVHSWNICGTYNLRTVDPETGEVHPVWEGAFFTQGSSSGVAYDPAKGIVLLTLDEYTAQSTCTANAQTQKPGLYLTNISRPKPVFISDQIAFSSIWDQRLKLFLAQTEDGAVQINTNGAVVGLVAPTSAIPIISPDGISWAWISDGFAYKPAGLWIGTAARSKPAQVSSNAVYYAVWSPDSQHLFSFTDSGLVVTDRSGNSPMLLIDGARLAGNAAWVVP